MEVLGSVFRLVMISVVTASALAQALPSARISSAHVQAGRGITIEIFVESASTQNFAASLTYKRRDGPGTIYCSGNIGNNTSQNVRISCMTDRNTPPGEYAAEPSSFFVIRPDTGEKQQIQDLPPEFFTVDPPEPIPITRFPRITGAHLAPDVNASFFDASVRSKDVLGELAKNFSPTARDTPQNRAYLRSQTEVAKNIIDLTRRRIESSMGRMPDPNVRIGFEDFDRRFDRILGDLNRRVSQNERLGTMKGLTLTSFQKQGRAQISESVTVDAGNVAPKNQLQKSFNDLVSAVLDMATGFLTISNNGSTTFVWSVTTTPVGAEIWYSRLGEQEIKWQGTSDQKNLTLPKARWKIRLVWSGCSKPELLNPWLQNPIPVQDVQAGCTQDVSP
ncbi:MAG: hypothetical protein ACRYF4_08315 [Janthinobacterium lividum]